MKTVSLPESLHSIRSDAFRQCKTLESIRISENVDSIGSNSFQGCIGLKEVVIQGGNTDLVIEWGTFGDCGFEDIVLPDRLTYIGHSVFMGCSNLKNHFAQRDYCNRTQFVSRNLSCQVGDSRWGD